MWEKVTQYAIDSGAGLWAVLFIALLTWVVKTNNDREKRYIGVIADQAKALGGNKDMAHDVADIKRWLEPGGALHKGGGGE